MKAPNGGNIYAWSGETKLYGGWPGVAITSGEAVQLGDDIFYAFTMDDCETVNVIFNNNGNQTANIEGIDSDVYYEYDGDKTAKKLDNVVTTPQASVTFSPNGGNFSEDVITVTATAKNAVSAWYKIGNGAQQNFSNTAEFKIGEGMSNSDSVTVSWSATNSEGTVRTGNVTFTKSHGGNNDEPNGDFVVYYDNSQTNWGTVKIHYWGGADATEWPGVDMKQHSCGHYYLELPAGTSGVVFNNGSGDQTNNIEPPVHNNIYKGTGNRNFTSSTHQCSASAVGTVYSDENAPAEIYNLQGVKVTNPGPGIYIVVKGKKSKKIQIR